MRQHDEQRREEANPLNYEPRIERQRELMGPSDRAGWIITAIIIIFILAFLSLAIT